MGRSGDGKRSILFGWPKNSMARKCLDLPQVNLTRGFYVITRLRGNLTRPWFLLYRVACVAGAIKKGRGGGESHSRSQTP